MGADQQAQQKVVLYRARVSSWRKPVCKIYVDRVTESSYWVNGRRYSRKSEPDDLCRAENHFESLDQAKNWLDEQLAYLIDGFQQQAQSLQDRLEGARALTESEVEAEEA